MNRATLFLDFVPTFPTDPAVPLTSPAALMTLGSLVLLSAGYAVSSRRMR